LSSSATICRGVSDSAVVVVVDGDAVVRVDADRRGDPHPFLGDFPRRQGRVLGECFRRGHGIRAPGPDRNDPVVGLDQIAIARQEICGFDVHDEEHGFQPAQRPVSSPVLDELDDRSFQVAPVLLQLRLEAGEQRERVGGRAGESGKDPVVVQLPDLAGGLLDDGFTEGHLAVAGHYRGVPVADRQNRRCEEHQKGDRIKTAPVTVRADAARDAPSGGHACAPSGTAEGGKEE
jgi:hypothetical protein